MEVAPPGGGVAAVGDASGVPVGLTEADGDAAGVTVAVAVTVGLASPGAAVTVAVAAVVEVAAGVAGPAEEHAPRVTQPAASRPTRMPRRNIPAPCPAPKWPLDRRSSVRQRVAHNVPDIPCRSGDRPRPPAALYHRGSPPDRGAEVTTCDDG
ncbi:MAG: hypothetical protein AMXMBFR23_25290 [Chloroflexota bacterium]